MKSFIRISLVAVLFTLLCGAPSYGKKKPPKGVAPCIGGGPIGGAAIIADVAVAVPGEGVLAGFHGYTCCNGQFRYRTDGGTEPPAPPSQVLVWAVFVDIAAAVLIRVSGVGLLHRRWGRRPRAADHDADAIDADLRW